MAVSRILLVSGSANFSTRDVWDGYRIGLEMRGIPVVPYPAFSFLKVLSPEAVCNDIIGTALDVANAIDCVAFVDGLYFRGKRGRVPLSIKKAGIPTVLIATDDPYEQIGDADSLYTYRFTNEIRCVNDAVTYLPTATAPLPELPRIASPRWDVSFLGTIFEERVPILREVAEYCEQQGLRFLIAGKFINGTGEFAEFPATELRPGTIDNPAKWEIYANSRLTLNLFRNSETPADSPSPRVFEVAGFGHAALLSGGPRNEVAHLFGDSIYEFDDPASATAAIQHALGDDDDRLARVDKARDIALNSHTYEHRAAELLSRLRDGEHRRSVATTSEERIAWIIGCGRTGSTWLAEMLGDLPNIRRWHEPYFGRLFRHVHDKPRDLERRSSFFAKPHRDVWLDGLREMFFRMVRARYPKFGDHGLAIKEVNTPELYGWLRVLFPAGRVIFLKRDPYDVLDSYLDLQKPGSWNTEFGDGETPLSSANVRRTAEHIAAAMHAAREACELFPDTARLEIAYEELLDDPTPRLTACGALIGFPIKSDQAAEVVERHRFQNYKKTGQLEFRRSGQAGLWKESANFTPEVVAIAEEILGPLRTRLGYSGSE